jgi:hypothetical protein
VGLSNNEGFNKISNCSFAKVKVDMNSWEYFLNRKEEKNVRKFIARKTPYRYPKVMWGIKSNLLSKFKIICVDNEYFNEMYPEIVLILKLNGNVIMNFHEGRNIDYLRHFNNLIEEENLQNIKPEEALELFLIYSAILPWYKTSKELLGENEIEELNKINYMSRTVKKSIHDVMHLPFYKLNEKSYLLKIFYYPIDTIVFNKFEKVNFGDILVEIGRTGVIKNINFSEF